MKFLRFFAYNNIVPITVSVVLLGAGSAFAAANPDAVLSTTEQVTSVDNTYIANKDLSTYTPTVRITGVTEDTEKYYVAYTISTIDIEKYVWQDVTKKDTMTVSKDDLKGRDLGLYVTEQFKNIIANQITYLTQVQQKERQNITRATVATEYGGLIGTFLDSKTETLPGYVPVVEPVAQQPAQTTSSQQAAAAGSDTPVQNQVVTSGNSQLSLQVLGNNPARVAAGSSYVDLGALLIDPTGSNVGYHTFLDGVETTSPSIDTKKTGSHTIEYRVTDIDGNVVVASRTVIIEENTEAGFTLTPEDSDTTQTPTE